MSLSVEKVFEILEFSHNNVALLYEKQCFVSYIAM